MEIIKRAAFRYLGEAARFFEGWAGWLCVVCPGV